jgi:predicted NUDIX family NTP pyrophosphohydrolase
MAVGRYLPAPPATLQGLTHPLDANGCPSDQPMPRSTRPNVSAGLLLFRRPGGRLEVFIAHPGGPFWKDRDSGAWTIPKGIVEAGEDFLAAARREFLEETSIQPNGPFIPLGSIRQKAGKTIHAWGWEGDADPAAIVSNKMRTEWPRGSGRTIEFPEVDRAAWFDPATAKAKMNPAQAELVDRLEAALVARDAAS